MLYVRTLYTYTVFTCCTFIQREENLRRSQQGEPPLPTSREAIDQELNLRPVNPPPRLDALLAGEQVESRCQQITEVAGNTFGKLYLTEGLQQQV